MIYAVNKRTKAHEVMDPNALYNTAVWEEVHADPDGWIEWQGGGCPLAEGVKHQIKFRDGEAVETSSAPEEWRWTFDHDNSDIIAYRPMLDAKVSHPGTMSGPDKFRADGGEPPAWDDAAEQLCKVYFDIAAEVIGEEQVRIRRDIKLRDAAEKRAKDAIAGEVLEAMDNGLGSCFKDVQIAAVIYAAIRDGKVPGVKLTGGEG